MSNKQLVKLALIIMLSQKIELNVFAEIKNCKEINEAKPTTCSICKDNFLPTEDLT